MVVTKSEMPQAAEVAERLREETDRPVLLISAMTGAGLNEFTEAVMTRVQQRRRAQLEAGEDVPVLRESQLATEKRKVPPHLRGATSQLSNEHQAKNFDPVVDSSDKDAP